MAATQTDYDSQIVSDAFEQAKLSMASAQPDYDAQLWRACFKTDYDAELASAESFEQGNSFIVYRKIIDLIGAIAAQQLAREAVCGLDAAPASPDTRELMRVLSTTAAEWFAQDPELSPE